MRARILAARQKTTEYRRIPAMIGLEYAGLRCERTPIPLRPRPRPRRHRCRRHLSARRKRDVVRRSPRGLLLHSRALERWPRITVRECHKRPARHSVRAARYKRCREPTPLFPTSLLIICRSAGDGRYRSAHRPLVISSAKRHTTITKTCRASVTRE